MNGILIIDKPEGFTSHDVVSKLRKILQMKSVGHTGTLDPFATGVLVALVGRATRLAQFLDKAEKEYLATIKFGFETDTGDRTGLQTTDCRLEIDEIKERLTLANIEQTLSKFRGESLQTPPMYSAKKIDGKKLYELARQGKEVERQPVKITISSLEIDELQIANHELRVRVAVSAGTYIRVLAADIGRELGTSAHLSELRRTRAGAFDLSQALSLDDLRNLADANQLEKALISPNAALAHLPAVVLGREGVNKIINGAKFFAADLDFKDGEFVKMNDEQANLIAIGVFDQFEKTIQPRVVLASAEK